MTLQYSQPSLSSLLARFDSFLATTTNQPPSAPSSSLSPSTQPQIQLLSLYQARLTLQRLIERGQVCGERKNWKGQETSYLLFLVERHCHAQQVKSERLGPSDWQVIASLFPHRSPSACQFRFLSLRPTSISSVPWSSQEEQLLLRIIQNQKGGQMNWRHISQQLYQACNQGHFRTGKQCREHYSCFLKPDLKKGAWTDQEDYLLMSLFLRMGKRWSKMTKLIEGRNENAIKNRFFLMFENRRDKRLSSPDLVKMVRRRKEKIEKKIAPSTEDRSMEEQTPPQQHGDSSLLQFSPMRQPDLMTNPSSIISQIFISEQPGGFSSKFYQQLMACEQFERYIDF